MENFMKRKIREYESNTRQRAIEAITKRYYQILQDAIDSYERGMTLKKHCEQKLAEAQEKIEKITVGPDGQISAQPFETE